LNLDIAYRNPKLCSDIFLWIHDVRALWKIDVYLISTLVNKSLHYYTE